MPIDDTTAPAAGAVSDQTAADKAAPGEPVFDADAWIEQQLATDRRNLALRMQYGRERRRQM